MLPKNFLFPLGKNDVNYENFLILLLYNTLLYNYQFASMVHASGEL